MPAGGERLRGSPRPTAGTADLQLTWEGVSREYRSRELSAPLEYVRTHSARSGEQRGADGWVATRQSTLMPARVSYV